MKDEEFELQALIFFRKYGKYYSESFPIDVESDAYEFVRNNKDFKYKDRVESDVLVTKLVELGYLQFEKRENHTRYHSLTKKGVEQIQKNQL